MANGEDFTRWARAAQPQLLRAAYLMSGDHHRAEDLVQEALTKVAARWRRLRDGSPEAYARTVIYHDHISWWRTRRHEVLIAQQMEPTAAEVAEPERRVVLLRALLALPPRQRAVVVLRYFEDLTEQETARVLGVTAGTVKSQAHTALRRLRETSPELAGLLREEAR